MGATRGVVVLVEGPSDVAAVEAVLDSAGLTEGVEVRSMGGVTNIRTALATVLGERPAPRVLGLCDEGEVDVVLRAVRAAGAPVVSAADLPDLGFHACRGDLEDELIRAVGAAEAVALLGGLGLEASFERFRRQPAWRGRDLGASLARFAGAGSGRKVRVGRALARSLPLERLPEPLARLVAQVAAARDDTTGPSLGTVAALPSREG
ncbi:hypothetical protein [Oryzobacter terrae]|uniref:hypothetical protein n=1 Tax=Oryzobacter terrae TaxID=1620385 RepID=UPI00367154B8